ncbi:MAG: hypothetical protein EOP06_00145 [Proteobacteria bacterium]|nr:MAG: hypothetical protein EOP06_00145 [Pseudomonadota bacterium]
MNKIVGAMVVSAIIHSLVVALLRDDMLSMGLRIANVNSSVDPMIISVLLERSEQPEHQKPRVKRPRRPTAGMLARRRVAQSASPTRNEDFRELAAIEGEVLGGKIANAKELGIDVHYPLLSRRYGEQGLVVLKIDIKGFDFKTVLEKSSGFERLDLAAQYALAEALSDPKNRNRIIAESGPITFRFVLR